MDHAIYYCLYAKVVWGMVLADLGIAWHPNDIDSALALLETLARFNSHNQILATIVGMIYLFGRQGIVGLMIAPIQLLGLWPYLYYP